MHTVGAADKKPNCQLGPVVFAMIDVNRVPTKALVDTGSPATTISLEFVLNILTKVPSPQQTPAQWQAETLEQFVEPNVVLSTYGGQRSHILVETTLQLSQGGQTVDAPVLVQKNASNPLLLGTDQQQKLGFMLVIAGRQNRVDSLAGSRVDQRPMEMDKPGGLGPKKSDNSKLDRSLPRQLRDGSGRGGAGWVCWYGPERVSVSLAHGYIFYSCPAREGGGTGGE